MKIQLRSLLTLLAIVPAALFSGADATPSAKNCGCECCKGKEVCCCQAEKAAVPEAKPAATPRYPLTGVVIDVLPSRDALLVKHEAIPDYMKAMTMAFKVDASTLKTTPKGQSITAILTKRDGEFWLEDVKLAPAK